MVERHPQPNRVKVLQLIERGRLGIEMVPKCWYQSLRQPSSPLSITASLLLRYIRIELIKVATKSLVILNTLSHNICLTGNPPIARK
jgi:hypothetical protein